MKTNVSYESLVLHLVEVFENPSMLQDYNNDGVSYESWADWFDLAMAPLSRGAYVETFGAKVMAKAENTVKKIIQEKQEATEKSEYKKLAREAEIVGDTLPEAGNYYFAYCSNMCAAGHYLNELDCLVNGVNADYTHKELLLVCDVITVDPATFSDLEKLPEFLENYISEKGEAVPCGSVSTDIKDNLLPGSGHYFLNVFAVVCGSRWFFVDTEGHNYAKYILLPCNYMEMYAPEIAAMKDEKAKAQKEEEEREAKEKEARRAEYVERCRRWWPLMRDVRPLKAALDAAPYGSRGSQERKENNKKNRELLNARRTNILAMVHAVFPGLKVSVTINHGWGSDYTLTYTDGPTLEEFTSKLDLDLFRSAWDTFSGWDDSTGREHSEFTDFADFTMCGCDGDIEAVREISDAKNDEALQKIFALLGVTDIKHQPSEEEAGDIARAFGLSSEVRDWLKGAYNLRAAAEIVARNLDYWEAAPTAEDTAAADTTAEDVATVPGDSVAGHDSAADEQDAAPADGLTLEDIPGGVAVIGNTRATYKNRKEIKAHGAKWNKDAQQWQATDPAAVASLRAWFALRDAAAPAAEEDTTTAEESTTTAEESTTTAAEVTAEATAEDVATVPGDFVAGHDSTPAPDADFAPVSLDDDFDTIPTEEEDTPAPLDDDFDPIPTEDDETTAAVVVPFLSGLTDIYNILASIPEIKRKETAAALSQVFASVARSLQAVADACKAEDKPQETAQQPTQQPTQQPEEIEAAEVIETAEIIDETPTISQAHTLHPLPTVVEVIQEQNNATLTPAARLAHVCEVLTDMIPDAAPLVAVFKQQFESMADDPAPALLPQLAEGLAGLIDGTEAEHLAPWIASIPCAS